MMMMSCKEEKEIIEEIIYDIESDSLCLANPVWFNIDPITHKRNTPAPEEGLTSAFGDNDSVTNCDFHKWSWQKFLWLTNEQESGRPLFMDNLIQVNNQNTKIPNTHGKIILTKNDTVNDTHQATGDVLRTNANFSVDTSSYDVYYSIHVNDTLHNTINHFAGMDPSEYVDATFPISSLEVKIAWVDARAIKIDSTYFVTEGFINGTLTPIALLGMHVVGIVYNHPEFIWATFEHQDLVPNYDWKNTTATEDVKVTSSDKLLFNANDTATIANLASHYLKPELDSFSVFSVNKYGTPRAPGNKFLTTSQPGKENFDNIEEINADVKSQLKGVWNNYFYNGSVWVNTATYSYPTEQAQLLVTLGDSLHEALPKTESKPASLLRGSVAAYNITMETYEQLGFNPPATIGQQSVATMGNCFSCHSAGTSALSISHLFHGKVANNNGFTPMETKHKNLKKIEAFVKKMNVKK